MHYSFLISNQKPDENAAKARIDALKSAAIRADLSMA
jgi:hypothetical protein